MAKSVDLAWLAASVFLVGCQTMEQHQTDVNASLDARLSAYHGSTIADITARTGMLPIDAYDVSIGRVFVFRTDPVYLTLPVTHVTPAVTRSAQCQLLLRAEQNGAGGTADGWRIVGTQAIRRLQQLACISACGWPGQKAAFESRHIEAAPALS